MSKTFKIVDNDISDGYHTFNELYEHRIALYIRLCHLIGDCHIRKDHYEGWDAVYLLLPEGQISYHLPNKYRCCLPPSTKEVDESFYDGHDTEKVLDRLFYSRYEILKELEE